MQKNVQNDMLATAPVSKLMFKFAVPSIIGMLVGALYNIVDQLFIGNVVGPLGNAATNIVFPLSTSCIAIALLAGIGAASCFNLSMGRGETEKAPKFVGNSVFMMVVVSILLTAGVLVFMKPILNILGSSENVMPYAVEYTRITALGFPFLVLTTGGGHLIRADGNPKMTMVVNLLGAVINIFLDALFVVVLGWGMAGAALATIIGQIISAIVVIVCLTRFKTVPLKISHFVPNLRCIGRISSIGMASFINQLAMMVVQIVLNNYLGIYGAASEYGQDIPITCAGIIMKVNMIVFSIVIGLAQGTQPIQSFNYGAKNFKRVKESYKLAIGCGAVIAVVAFIAYQLIPEQIVSLFGGGGENAEAYFEFSKKFFRIFMFFTFINFVQPITSTFFTSIGKPVKGVILSLSKNILCFLPVLLVLPIFFGIDGILFTGPVADFMAAVLNISLVVYEFKLMKKEEKLMKLS